jgi:hypothetical protein
MQMLAISQMTVEQDTNGACKVQDASHPTSFVCSVSSTVL